MLNETDPTRTRYVSGDGKVIPAGQYKHREPGIDTITLQVDHGVWRHRWQMAPRKWWQRLLAIPPKRYLQRWVDWNEKWTSVDSIDVEVFDD